MDNKTIFIKTKKGEDEAQGKTTHLPGDIKRALLMVDGHATFGEINKRAAPSLRSSLDELFRELQRGGFIQDKSQAEIRGGNIPKMSVPLKMAAPRKTQPENRAGELDFMGGFPADPSDGPAKTQKLSADAEENIKGEIEAAKYSAQLEAEAILLRAEQEAARIREEIASAKSNADQEARQRLEHAEQVRRQAKRLNEEQEALQVRIKLDAAREKAEQEAKIRLEATAKAQARIDSDDEDSRRREEVERLLKQEQDARERVEVERRLKQEQEARERAARELKAHEELKAARVREEVERIVRQEQEARERAARELKAQEELNSAKIREEVERLMRQEQEEREAKARDQATRTPHEISPGSDSFSFGSFHVDNPLYTSESHMEKQSPKRDEPPAKKIRPGPVDEKPGTFTFDAFQVDEPPLPVEPARNKQPDATAETSRPAGKQQAVPPAYTKPLTGESGQQQIQRAMQERNAAEQRMAGEQLAEKKLAGEQSRAWAEAERRALEAAKADVEQASRQIAYTVAESPATRPSPVVRTRRKQFNWGVLIGLAFKTGLFLLLLIIGALFVIPYFISTREYLPRAEQLLSTKLHQPVHIGSLSARILPTPRLELGEIYIGNAKQLQVNVAQINFSFSGLFADVKPINSIEFQGIKVRGAWLADASGWMQQMAGDDRFPVSRMVISNGTLDADVLELTGMEGTLDFDPGGKFVRTSLSANSGKYSVGINAAPGNLFHVAITVRGSALPLLPNWTFEELTANGQMGNGDLLISDFDARMLGGVLHGDADINWHSGWHAQGALNAKTISMQKLNKLLDGNVAGSARFRMASADLSGLTDSATLDGNFSSSDGTISGLEIADTARKLSTENLPGGRTHYDGLTGNFSFENGAYHFKQTRITASSLSAIAAFDVDTADQQLSGKMGVTLSLPGRTTSPVELKMGGTTDSPTLVYAP